MEEKKSTTRMMIKFSRWKKEEEYDEGANEIGSM